MTTGESFTLYLANIDGGIKANIVNNGGEVVLSKIDQFLTMQFEQNESTHAIKITSELDSYGRELGCCLIYMTKAQFNNICVPDFWRYRDNIKFKLKKQLIVDDEPPLAPPILMRNQPSITETYFTESRFRELTLRLIDGEDGGEGDGEDGGEGDGEGDGEDRLPSVAPVYIRSSNT